MKVLTVFLSALALLFPRCSFAQAGSSAPAIRSLSTLPDVPPALRPSPELVIRQADGKQLLLSNFRGRVVALVFLQTNCPVCQEVSRVFARLSSEFGARGFQPLGVAFNPKADFSVAEFSKKSGANFPIGASSLEEVMKYLGLPSSQRFNIPQIVWIDRDGNIRAQTPALEMESDLMLTETYWRNMIGTLLNEAGNARKN